VRGLDSFTTFYEPYRKHENLAEASAHPAFELLRGDLLSDILDEALEDVDVVAHLAGEPGVTTSWGSSFNRYLERNVLATQRLLEAVSARRVRRLVFASSSSVYGRKADLRIGGGELRPASPYGVTKLAAEKLVGAYAETGAVHAVSLRYFSVYGPRQRPDMAAHRFIEALLGRQPLTVFGDGDQVRDFTYVDDVVAATVNALFVDLPSGAVLDVASGRPTSVGELVEHLQDLVGTRADSRHTGERRGDVPRTEGTLEATMEYLSWRPQTDLRTGLVRQLSWHRDIAGREPQADVGTHIAERAPLRTAGV